MADALKLIGKRCAAETLTQLKADTDNQSLIKPAKKRGGRKESSLNDDLSDSDDDFSKDDDDQFGDDGQKRERR